MSDRPTYFVHESSYVDEPCEIGAGTKIWHFSHIMQDCRIGKNCNLGQNVVSCRGASSATTSRSRTTCRSTPE